MELSTECGIEFSRDELTQKLGDEPEFAMADSRNVYIHNIDSNVTEASLKKVTHIDKLDRFFLNRFLGIPLFLFIMYLVFWVAVNIGNAFVDFFDIACVAIFVEGVAVVLNKMGAPEFLVTLLSAGVGTGIQTVATFIPVVAFMFFCLTFLEDSGYMARAAFVADRFMRFLGLPGRAFVPMLRGLWL